MKQLDELITKLDSLYIPIYVKGKEYPGNNPYILNKINNMLRAGRLKKKYGELTEPVETLEPDDLKWEDNSLHFNEDKEYLYFDELDRINMDICDEVDRLTGEEYRRRFPAEGKQ
jgi:hypothetical protein